ncbi:hypothetical protein IFM89_014244 [Coptis chinensis]|uniref:DUF7705 domain-containing protein n=1 Tax=Coptis chinensis TaxID=261450 RepID=A0A835M5S7_9MAGN|nr:hypothetical protein IFM89_014244 [Coptis chinensis]
MDCSIEQMREQARERYRVRRLLMDDERINTQNVRRVQKKTSERDEQRQTNVVGAVARDQNITSQISDTYSGVQQTPVTTFMRRHRNYNGEDGGDPNIALNLLAIANTGNAAFLDELLKDPGTPPARRQWMSIDLGTEVYKDANSLTEWTVSELDIVVPKQ